MKTMLLTVFLLSGCAWQRAEIPSRPVEVNTGQVAVYNCESTRTRNPNRVCTYQGKTRP
jgi:hypothetical protein